jgi:importin-7
MMQGQRLRESAERKEHDALDGGASDASDEEEIEEELGFISPLDAVNPYVTFKQALIGTLPSSHPQFPQPLLKLMLK